MKMKRLLVFGLAVMFMFCAGNAFAGGCFFPPCVVGDYQIDENMSVASQPYEKYRVGNNGAEDFGYGTGYTVHSGSLDIQGNSPDTWGEMGGNSDIDAQVQAHQFELNNGEMSKAKARTSGDGYAWGEGEGVDCPWTFSTKDDAALNLGVSGRYIAQVGVYSDDRDSDSFAGGTAILDFNAWDSDYDRGAFGHNGGGCLNYFRDLCDLTAGVDDSMHAGGSARAETKAFALQTENFVHVASTVELKGDAWECGAEGITGGLSGDAYVGGNAVMPAQGIASYSGTMEFSGAPLGTKMVATGQATISNGPGNSASTFISVHFNAKTGGSNNLD